MKFSTVIIFLVALVLIYFAYRFFFKENVTPAAINYDNEIIPVIPRPNPYSTSLEIVSAECTKLPQLKLYIGDLYNATKRHYDDMKQGFGISKAGLITDPVLLKEIFDSSNYTYNNEIIKYNSIINQYKCEGAELIGPTQFGAIS